jgi:DNA-binding transcriptional regulator YhcF (GntR family)
MRAEAPYRRIVTEIRDRIARGELRPGDPAPSTRRIVQEYGVAMATATKVVAALRDEGLVDTRPGAGSVVRSPVATRPAGSRRGAPREQELSRDSVIRAAIAVADAEGLGTLSMRRVATDLGVATMSLYRHVASKDELMLLMADAVAAEERFPAPPPPGWRDRLEAVARMMWRVFRRHPWAAEVLSLTRPQATPNVIPLAEWSLRTLNELGLGAEETMYTHLSLFGHVRGMALSLQSEAQAEQETGMTNVEWLESTGENAAALIIDTGRYPALAEAIERPFEYHLDAVFEYGLQRLLDGVEARHGEVRHGVEARRRSTAGAAGPSR